MAEIREVLQHPDTKKWAYIEHSDENNNMTILGDKEFSTREEAELWSEGFKPFNYQWQDFKQIRIKELEDELHRMEARIDEIYVELTRLHQ